MNAALTEPRLDQLTEPRLDRFIQPGPMIKSVHGTIVDQVEQTFFAWITVASIFLAAALVINAFKPSYALFFLPISILLLLAGAFDYLAEGQVLIRSGLDIPTRLPILFWIILAVIVIEVILLFDLWAEVRCKRTS